LVRAPLVTVWVSLGAAVFGGWLMLRPAEAPASRARDRAHELPAVRRAADPFARWTITEQFAAHHAVVIQVETRHLGDATRIAREIAEPLQVRYSEMLMYFHRPGRPDTLPPRRVQWTRSAGYVETNFDTTAARD
jgi:hypothetical protein